MTLATFSLPIDIPWQRIAFSEDMMDKVACDRALPLRWRSSVAVFEYEPPADQQGIEGFLISYLKVSCSITGYQPDGAEIQIRNRLARSGWTHKDMGDTLQQTFNAYYPCFGAMLEVVVSPPNVEGIPFKDYPYFVDFDPKKRELYEQVTDTGEVMSRSLDDVSVRRGQMTLQSHEVKDKVSAGAKAEIMGIGLSGGVDSTTTDLSERKTENIRSTDALRENRETLSHMTQLSQMYQQLNSYHVGTNRAAFFVLPRPHVVQTPHTFVNGPREIEGIQDFMLIVVRRADQEHYCVEAYLETAHLVRTPKLKPDEAQTGTLTLGPSNFGEGVTLSGDYGAYKTYNKYTASVPFTVPPGYEIDVARDETGAAPYGGGPGYKINNINQTGIVQLSWDIGADHAILNATLISPLVGRVTSLHFQEASVDLSASIYLKKKIPGVDSYSDRLLLTGRAVCSCETRPDIRTTPIEHGLSVTYEKALEASGSVGGRERAAMSISDANRFSAGIRQEMLQSLTSPDRYPRGAVSLLDTQLVADVIGANLRSVGKMLNPRLADWSGDAEDIARRVARYVPRMTRSDLLHMSLPEQVERFGITFEESLSLRRAFANLPAPEGMPPVPAHTPVNMPRLTGRKLADARAALADADLVVGTVEETDCHLIAGMVVAQDPEPGSAVDAGTEVALSISSGLSVLLPDVIGLGLAEAMCRLLDAGLLSEPSIDGPTGTNTHVVELEPQAGTPITPHASVTIRLRKGRKPRGPVK